MNTATLAPARPTAPGPCPHTPVCPPATAPDAQAARMTVDRPEQGWSVLCNGLILVDHEPVPTIEHRPRRIQRRRTAGSRMPAGAVYVGRPTVFGNPFRADVHTRVGAVQLYRIWAPEQPDLMAAVRERLRGADLACFCPLGQPCHADVLLDLAAAMDDQEPAHPAGEHHFPLGAPDDAGYAQPGDCACGMTYQQYDAEMGWRILVALLDPRRPR